jgi:hypothetical protein
VEQHAGGRDSRACISGIWPTRSARLKQWITGLSFFLSSGAAATVIGHAPAWVPALLAVATAVMTAYAIAVGLDRKMQTLVKLGSSWREIAAADIAAKWLTEVTH